MLNSSFYIWFGFSCQLLRVTSQLFEFLKHRRHAYYFEFRYFMQDVRDLSAGVLCALHRSLHVFRQCLQHLHENFLHWIDSHNHLPYALQASFLHYLRRARWLVPSHQNSAACRRIAHMYFKHWMDCLAIFMEFLLVVGGSRVCTVNRNAPQDACGWEPDFELRRVPRVVSILLHS